MSQPNSFSSSLFFVFPPRNRQTAERVSDCSLFSPAPRIAVLFPRNVTFFPVLFFSFFWEFVFYPRTSTRTSYKYCTRSQSAFLALDLPVARVTYLQTFRFGEFAENVRGWWTEDEEGEEDGVVAFFWLALKLDFSQRFFFSSLLFQAS